MLRVSKVMRLRDGCFTLDYLQHWVAYFATYLLSPVRAPVHALLSCSLNPLMLIMTLFVMLHNSEACNECIDVILDV